jgi:hypothetical protein
MASFLEIPGDDVFEKLDSYYLFFRNRFHFGTKSYNSFHENPVWLSLLSLNLLKAARSQTAEQRNNFSIVLDLTHKLSSILPRIRYADDFLISAEKEILIDSNRSRWLKAQKKIQRSTKASVCLGKIDLPSYSKSQNSFMEQKSADAKSCFAELLRSSGIVPPDMKEELDKGLKTDMFSRLYFAKLTSIYDQMQLIS